MNFKFTVFIWLFVINQVSLVFGRPPPTTRPEKTCVNAMSSAANGTPVTITMCYVKRVSKRINKTGLQPISRTCTEEKIRQLKKPKRFKN